jgi:hypothetical protein
MPCTDDTDSMSSDTEMCDDDSFTCILIPAWSISDEDLSCINVSCRYAKHDFKRVLGIEDVRMSRTGNCKICVITDPDASDDEPPNPVASMLLRRQVRGHAILTHFDRGCYRFVDLVDERRDMDFYTQDACENLVRLCCTWKL